MNENELYFSYFAMINLIFILLFHYLSINTTMFEKVPVYLQKERYLLMKHSDNMEKNIQDIINEIESGAIKEGMRPNREGVIVVDSIEDFMRENNAIRLEDLDKYIKH